MHCLWINVLHRSAFSAVLPAETNVLMRFSDSTAEAEGALCKVHGQARITLGWQEFAAANHVSSGSVYIFKFYRVGGHLHLAMYNA
ncbi:hypothetical protein EJB05_13053, partial [Eragrostis curvula]